jgi:hypothetical protein
MVTGHIMVVIGVGRGPWLDRFHRAVAPHLDLVFKDFIDWYPRLTEEYCGLAGMPYRLPRCTCQGYIAGKNAAAETAPA